MTELEQKTRAIFHELHKGQVETAEAANRVRNLLNTENLKLPEDFFMNKLCADLGRGSAANGAYNLLQLGAKFVYAMDLNDKFFDLAESALSAVDEFKNRYRLDVGSLECLPYEDEYFDFVLCQGVIHHVDDDKKAVKEIARVLKPGGTGHFMVHGKGGLVTRFVMEVFRDEYNNNLMLKKMVDDKLSGASFSETIYWLSERIDDDGTEIYQNCQNLLGALKKLLDEDVVLTVKDRLRAPLYKMYTEEEFWGMLKDAGFSSYYRISKKPEYKNIRKILSPLYHEYDSPLARLL